jgi:hydrogenase maturation protein HypF
MEGVERIAVQHHHAHIAACLADNGVEGPAIGVAFDGLGYGLDGTLWGGEFLIADLSGFERVGYLDPVPMPGGTQAIREPWRMAAVYLDRAYAGEPPLNLEVVARNRTAWSMVTRLARAGVHAPLTSSVGRLFDAVAAILGVRDTMRYEGQAAVELEQWADPDERGAYAAAFKVTAPHVLQGADLVRAAVDDLGAGVAPEIVAARFHNGVARAVVAVASLIRANSSLDTVALSGGVFQNTLLIERTADGLEQAGFRVLTHHRVPANDGGISFGQAVVAAAQVRRSLMKSGG